MASVRIPPEEDRHSCNALLMPCPPRAMDGDNGTFPERCGSLRSVLTSLRRSERNALVKGVGSQSAGLSGLNESDVDSVKLMPRAVNLMSGSVNLMPVRT